MNPVPRIFPIWALIASTGLQPPAAAQASDTGPERLLPPIVGLARLYYKYRKPDVLQTDAFPGGRAIEVEVGIETFGSSSIDLKGCRQIHPRPAGGPDPAVINCDVQRDPEPRRGRYGTVTTYTCNLEISGKAQPRIYKLALQFFVPNRPIETRSIDLPVGAQDSSQLEVKSTTPQPVVATSGWNGDIGAIALTITNHYPDYPVRIRDIKPRCAITGLLRRYTVDPPLPVTLNPAGGRRTFEVTPIPGALSLNQMLHGVQPDPTLDLRVFYDDTIRAPAEIDPPYLVKLKLGFDLLVTLAAAVLGAVIGVLMRLGLEYNRSARRRPGIAMAMKGAVSVALGLFIVLLAQLVKPELLFDRGAFRLSYDHPVVGLLLGWLVGLYDPSSVVDAVRRLLHLGTPTPRRPAH